MRIYPFWNRIVESDCIGQYVCTGLMADFGNFLEVLGSLQASEPFQLIQQNLTEKGAVQQSLFEDNEREEWGLMIIPQGAKNQKEAVMRLLNTQSSYAVSWIFWESPAENLPDSIEVLTVSMPTEEQWKAVLKKYAPLYQGPISVPQNLQDAASDLRSLALTGEYPGDPLEQLEGSGWEKFRFLWDRPFNLTPLAIADLIQISYCLEAIHEKIAFPKNSASSLPPFVQKMLSPKVMLLLGKEGVPLLAKILRDIQRLDSESATLALCEWIFLLRQFVQSEQSQV